MSSSAYTHPAAAPLPPPVLAQTPLHHILQWRATAQGDRTAYIYLGDTGEPEAQYTYAELDGLARRVAAALLAQCQPGDRALLLYPPGLDFVAAFFGCLYAGVIAVPANPPRHRRLVSRLDAIRTDARPAVTLTTGPLLRRLTTEVADGSLASATTIVTDALPAADDVALPPTDLDSLALLQYTSGSTSTPKGVVVSHRNLTYNEEFVKRAVTLTEKSLSVSWLPIYHDMGLIEGLLQPTYSGFTGVLMSPFAFIQKPIRWLTALSRYRATHAGAPNFAYDLCVEKVTDAQLATLDLSAMDSLYSGAEPIRHSTMMRFHERFAACGLNPRTRYASYGLAEATLMVSGEWRPRCAMVSASGLERGVAADVTGDDDRAIAIVSCGTSAHETTLLVVDPATGRACPDNVVGEILVGGPTVAQGYWERPAETAETFGATVEGHAGRFLRTGDLGFARDGGVYVTGRSKDLIIVRGRNHYPQDIESIVQQAHPALRPDSGAAFSVDGPDGEQLVVVHEIERTALRHTDMDSVAAAVAQSVTELTDLKVHALILIRPVTLPKTSSGKVQRRLCRTQYLRDELEVVYRWPAPKPTPPPGGGT